MTDKKLSKPQDSEAHGYMSAIKNLEHKIEDMLSNFWHNPFQHDNSTKSGLLNQSEGIPKIDLIDREKEIVVKAELPGINKKDLDISINDNRLYIKAKTFHEEEEEKGDYLRRETTTNEYYRSILLPADVDDENIKSDFKNGVLKLTLPKHESSHRKKIDIK